MVSMHETAPIQKTKQGSMFEDKSKGSNEHLSSSPFSLSDGAQSNEIPVH